MTFKIWVIDNPTYLKGILPLFQAKTNFTNRELVKLTPSVGLSGSLKRIEHFTKVWYILGILDRARDKNQAYRYTPSRFGNTILNALQFSPELAMDLLHWTWYSAWLKLPDFAWGWSWTYQQVCDALWESCPSQVMVNKLTTVILEKATSQFSGEEVSFDISSIRGVMTWLSALVPPFLVKKDEAKQSSSWLSYRRESCTPELLFLAIQLQYRVKELSLGTPLLMDEETIEAVCKVCMLAPARFWPMVDLCGLTFPTLVRNETLYGTSLNVTEAAPFTPPEPRPLNP